MPKNVWLLTVCQALLASCLTLVVFAGSLIGNNLAPSAKLSTLPVALFIIGTACNTVPVALLMQRYGRKLVFQLVAVVGIIAAGLAALSVMQQSFLFFCGSIFLLGSTIAAVQQFRFAAMESVESDQMPKAASMVLLGGVISAILGPEIAVAGKSILPGEYAGSFVLLAGVYFIGLILLSQYSNIESQETETDQPARALKTIMRQPVFWASVLGGVVGFSVMSFIMTATPISMHVIDGHSLEDTKTVIQSHIILMYLPSLITAWIIRKAGIATMMTIGLVAFGIALIWAFSGNQYLNYWVALALLGIGWNFLFVGGTTLLPKSYKSSERFKVQALNEFLVFGAQAIASLGAGWVLFQMGWQNLLLITIPFLLIQFTAITIYRRSL